MASINKVIIVGNLGADPESRTLASGDLVCNLRIATSDKWKDKTTGDPRESTEWHRVVLFRSLAQIAARYLRKGDAVYVEGKLRTRKWQGSDGVDRYTTEIEGSELKMLGGQRRATETGSSAAFTANQAVASPHLPRAPTNGPSHLADWLEDVPF